MKTLFLLVVAIGIGAIVFVGCNKQTDEGTQQEVQKSAADAWDKTKEAAGKFGDSVKKTSAQIAETAKVKGPLSASSDVDSSHLSVETIDKTIYLKGSVPTPEMKAKAEQMVKANADKEYIIDDSLKVVPNPDNPPKKGDSTPSVTDNDPAAMKKH